MSTQETQNLRRKEEAVVVMVCIGWKPLDEENTETCRKQVFGAFDRKELAFECLLFVGPTNMLQCDSVRRKQSFMHLLKVQMEEKAK